MSSTNDYALTDDQHTRYAEDGFLFVPDLIPDEDMARLRGELDGLCTLERREVITEKDARTVRSVMNPQTFSAVFERFVRHPRLLVPVEQLLQRQVYLFQCIINMKRPFGGDIWQWHQDFPTYFTDDGMPEPRAVNALVFIDEVGEFNGPLMIIPGSHTAPVYENAVDAETTSYPIRALDLDVVDRLANERGIAAPKGRPGSVIFAHTNFVHGSGPNLSPWPRTLASVTFNAVDNRHGPSRRPDWYLGSDFEPLTSIEPPL